MLARIGASGVLALALGGGIAFAASRSIQADDIQVCVNDVNGLMRAASECRQGESPLTIGGGSDVRVTQNGTSTVPFGEDGPGKTLPLTGVTVTPRCSFVTAPPAPEELALPRVALTAAAGNTMDAFAGSVSTIGGESLLLAPIGGARASAPQGFSSSPTVIVTSNGATATMVIGGGADFASRTCTFLWQAVEAPNET